MGATANISGKPKGPGSRITAQNKHGGLKSMVLWTHGLSETSILGSSAILQLANLLIFRGDSVLRTTTGL